MKRRSSYERPFQTLTLCILAGAAIGAWTKGAHAQPVEPGFALNRFEPSETGSEWFANDTLDLRGAFRPALGVVADYAYKPYVLINADDSENTVVVRNQFFFHIGGSLVILDRLRLGVSLPIATAQSGSPTGGLVNGQRIVSANKGGVGDLRIGADLRLAGEYGDAATLALGGRLWVPTGAPEKFLGDDEIRIGPHLSLAGDLGAFAYAGSVGVVHRGNDRPFAGHPTGTEAQFGLAFGIRAAEKKLLIGPELYGSSVVSDSDAFFGKRTTPLGLLGSLHYTAGIFRLGVGAGPGLSHAAGTARFRALGSLEIVPGIEEKRAPPPPPEQQLPSDRDEDGIVDTEDACPDVPGVRTDDPKTNGCPADRDKDGIVDPEDACPDVPGVRTDDPKTNGCPGDRDKDTIIDTEDACPDVPGPTNTDPKKNGCPLAFIKENQIQITEQIKFRFGKADLDPVSDNVLDAVLKVMQEHTEIAKIHIEGHTDNKGSADFNKKLSNARAAAVVNWLSKHGVDRAKLSSTGYGFDKPLDTNETDDGRANNRRVEFHIEGEGKPKP